MTAQDRPGEVPPLSSVDTSLVGGAPGLSPEEALTLGFVRVVVDALNALDVASIAALPERAALEAWATLEEANRVLAAVRSQVQHDVAEAMSSREVTVEGVGTFVRHVRKDRTQWDRDMLLRDVLDSRLVDKETGEVADESPVDKVLAVWNLGAPRTTVLRQRGLDADEYCRTEKRGYAIERI